MSTDNTSQSTNIGPIQSSNKKLVSEVNSDNTTTFNDSTTIQGVVVDKKDLGATIVKNLITPRWFVGKSNNWTPGRQGGRRSFHNDHRGDSKGGGFQISGGHNGNTAVTQQREPQILGFIKEQLEQIQTLLQPSPSPSAITGGASCSVVKTGNITSIFTL
ncbi:hypothetical protein LIER_05378 [Lithospermum erythrorhizon]|uniref:Uncharacterized protein n=1 Tax=Lithospermum erythrorhizon TaxID=34254 RepID=A0AAV3P332_LITER